MPLVSAFCMAIAAMKRDNASRGARDARRRHSVGRSRNSLSRLPRRCPYVFGVIAATTTRLLISVRLSPCFTRGSC